MPKNLKGWMQGRPGDSNILAGNAFALQKICRMSRAAVRYMYPARLCHALYVMSVGT